MKLIEIDNALHFDPFAGDFGEHGDRVLSDKIVTCKKDHNPCGHCCGPIKAGTKNRVRSEISGGEMMHFRWCQDCTRSMAEVEAKLSADEGEDDDADDNPFAPYERRHAMHRIDQN